jgi:hypothetical protein
MNGPTREDAELFGQDLIEFSQRAAAPVVREHVAHLERQLGEIRGEEQRQQLQSNRESVMRFLDSDTEFGSRWRDLNNDQAFIGWLSQRDPLSGEKLHDLLTRAFNAGDGSRCGHFFKSFIAQRRPEGSRTAHRHPFEHGRRQPSVTVRDTDNPRRIWTRQEISRFYRCPPRPLR